MFGGIVGVVMGIKSEILHFVMALKYVNRPSLIFYKKTLKILRGVDVKINKTERELKAKNPKRLKWLPQEDIALKSFFSPTYFDCLPQSSLVKTERGRIELIGVSELKGEEIIPREKGKGIFFDKEVINSYDFFTLQNTNLLLCTERVKEFCEDKAFNNIIFLEMGDII